MVTLNDANIMPSFGFGCFGSHGKSSQNAVSCALKNGYRYIDSAAWYKNECDVGAGIAASKLPRDEVFLVSKVWPTMFDDVSRAVESSCLDLGVDYLDACLLHWPGIDNDRMLRAAAALLSLRDSGKIKSVGVSNFQIEHLESYAARFGFYPSVNQIELHPFYQQRALVSFCVEHGIKVIAWSPILRARTLCVGVISAIAAAHRKSAAQIVLRWHVQKGHIPIPKSSNPVHILENRAVFNFSLADEEIAAIDALENGVHIGADPYTFNG